MDDVLKALEKYLGSLPKEQGRVNSVVIMSTVGTKKHHAINLYINEEVALIDNVQIALQKAGISLNEAHLEGK